MCGIVGIVGASMVSGRLLDGLRRLEYRGYDSAGLAVVDGGALQRRRAEGKIVNLENAVSENPCDGVIGIAHTRWATHGKPTTENAHPHQAGKVVIVHNGIIENFRELREELSSNGHTFASETDSEVIAHLIQDGLNQGLSMKEAFAASLNRMRGAYAIAAINEDQPDQIYAAREGSPLAIGVTEEESFLGSDAIALSTWTNRVVYLDEGDWCILRPGSAELFDAAGNAVQRPERITNAVAGGLDKGEYRHFMEKEIHEQPDAIARTLAHYIDTDTGLMRLDEISGWAETNRLVGTACGTAYYAIAVAKYWFEGIARLAVETDIASEFRYRDPVINERDRALVVSQSGETADTLAALRYCKSKGASTAALVNVPESSIAREADQTAFTYAGPEIGVASTKAFTAQLAALACLSVGVAHERKAIDDEKVRELTTALMQIPRLINEALEIEPQIIAVAHHLANARDALYLGRGAFYPLAMEGALKLKEISYIHAEGYAAGELKHGPIALIEDGTPVIVTAPHDALFEKTISNVHEVAARGAEVILITDAQGKEAAGDDIAHTLLVPTAHPLIQPLIVAAPIQQLAYHTAVLKGTDVDQPRNLAKSVTVE
ncbi:MAG: glutamine--fructose-6-phosphate transaminase (isomerizing) [Alphaproteobacteria bacterium]|nr:glutamine--fructose-6-phosphate transaminase (isomerizing) [Alphaproteobacteria bacterium]